MPLRSGPRNPIASSTRSALQLELAAGHRLERHAAVLADHLHLRRRAASSRGRCASPVKLLRGDRVEPLAAFLVRRRDAEDVRPRAATGCVGARRRADATAARADAPTRALAMRRAEAVGAGVAAADDDHVLVLRGDESRRRHLVAFAAAVLQRSGIPSRSGCPRARGPAPADRAAPWTRRRARSRRTRAASSSTGTLTPMLAAGLERRPLPRRISRAADREAASRA